MAEHAATLPVIHLPHPAGASDEPTGPAPRRRSYVLVGALVVLNIALVFGSLHLFDLLSLPFLERSDASVPVAAATPLTTTIKDSTSSSTVVSSDAVVIESDSAESPAVAVSSIDDQPTATSATTDGGLQATVDTDGNLVLVGSVPDMGAFDEVVALAVERLPGGEASVLAIVTEGPGTAPAFEALHVPVGDPLLFAEGLSGLDGSHRTALDLAATIAAAAPDVAIVVTGHASPEGDTANNLRLSTERVAGAVGYLLAAGVTEDRITTVAAGETTGAAEAEYAQHRRVDIELTGLFAEPEGN